jgi:hypothetical protein
MAVERCVVTVVVVAGVTAVLRRRRLLAALAGAQRLDPCPASPTCGGVSQYQSSSLESSSLTTGAPLVGCVAAAAGDTSQTYL